MRMSLNHFHFYFLLIGSDIKSKNLASVSYNSKPHYVKGFSSIEQEINKKSLTLFSFVKTVKKRGDLLNTLKGQEYEYIKQHKSR